MPVGPLAVTLEARAKFPESSLADLYDTLTMPADLQKAHRKLDRAVLKLYGLSPAASEAQIVVHLLKLYQEKLLEHNK